ncbi:MAG: hypothetical protein QGG36_09615 [Pirellulaceae bacterium]|jgi:hypothetical protein|nr:hypothetical protein [Pirellulaceae bacterium]MDP7016045.1 hypothetical protein [Pirellulaceae bacterium]
MLERNRPQRQRETPGGGPDNLSPADEGGMVTISSGVHSEALPVGSMLVGEIRRRFADRFDIDPASTAEVDGQAVSDDTVVQSGQLLIFSHRIGEKGRLKPVLAL